MTEHIDILVYGLGAVGCLYSFILSRTESVRITVVARSNYAAVKENGIKLESKIYGDQVFHPHSVVSSIEDASSFGPFAYVVFSHKALGAQSVPTGLDSVVNPQTTIVIMQNGVGNELPFRKALPESTMLTCSLWMSATQIKPGVIRHTASVKTPIGLYPHTTPSLSPPTELENSRLSQFASLLSSGRMPVEIHEDMQVQKWEKVVWNAAFNSLTALTQLDTQAWLHSSPEAASVTRRLMKELITVARLCGVDVRSDLDEVLLQQVLRLPAITSSMQVDVKEGRLLEVDIIFGSPLTMAREKGVDVPTLELLYAILTGINARMSKTSSD